MGRMLGPRTTSTDLASSGLAGRSTPLSSMEKRSGSCTSGYSPSSRGVGDVAEDGAGGGNFRRGEVDLRVSGAAAALEVAVEGAHGDAAGIGGKAHADAGPAGAFQHARAPLASMSASAPQAESICKTCLEPGEMMERLTVGATVLPFKMAATRRRSRSEELVQEPTQT